MANEARTEYLAGRSVYFTWANASAELWNASGTPAFEARVAANWTTPKYCHAATEKTVVGATYSEFVATIPVLITPAGRYRWTAYDRTGASPAVGDNWISSGYVDWSGLAELNLNNAVAGAAQSVIIQSDEVQIT